jgi:hypothetical protein
MLDRTTQSDPLIEHFHSGQFALTEIFYQLKDAIEDWFEQQWQQSSGLFYASMDLRNSGY